MGKKHGYNPIRILTAFCELQEPFGRRHPIWVEAGVLAIQMGEGVRTEQIVGIKRALHRMERDKLVQRKVIRSEPYYALTKSARDKYLEE